MPQKPSLNYQITNIVLYGDLHQPVSFPRLYELGSAFIYKPTSYHASYVQLSRAKVVLYRSGKFILTGVKSYEDIAKLWSEFKALLRPFLDIGLFEEPVIKNIVAQVQYPKEINLNEFHITHLDEDVEYEPEVFPGLHYKTPYATALIFRNGKMVLAGAKSLDEVEKARTYIFAKLDESDK